MEISDISVWSVEFSTVENQRYRANRYVTVISTTAQRAIEIVMEKHSNAVIHAINKRSRGDLYVDPQVQITQG
jgi:hypothetical protein